MPPLRTALLQSSGRLSDVAANLKVLDEAAGRAAETGAGLIVCPELFLTGYAIGDDVAELAEAADGPSAQAIADIAVRHGLAVVYGYPERDGDTVYNAAQLIGRRRQPPRELPQDAPLRLLRAGGVHAGRRAGRPGRAGRPPRRHDDLLRRGVPGERTGARPGRDGSAAGAHRADAPLPVRRRVRRAGRGPSRTSCTSRTSTGSVRRASSSSSGSSCLAGPDGAARGPRRTGRANCVVGDVDPEFLAASRANNPYLRDRRPGLYASLV